MESTLFYSFLGTIASAISGKSDAHLRIQCWVAFVPFGGLLICMRQCQDRSLRKRGADDLEPNRESGRSEPAGDADRRQSIDCERPEVPGPAGIQIRMLCEAQS